MKEQESTDSDGESNLDEISTKVGRLIEEYNLGKETGATLEERWTREDEERMSLRALADLFNKRLLETRMSNANMSTVDGETDNIYRLLTSNDVSRGKYTEARNRLAQDGIDVDELESNFVTYQAIRSYLQNEREAEYSEQSDEERLSSATESIQRLKARTATVSESTLERLRSGSIITLGEFRVIVDINVHCEDCESQFGIIDLLRDGGCGCQ